MQLSKKISSIIIFFFILLFSQNIKAQDTEIDSLLNEFRTTNIDTTKVNILNTITQKLYYSNSDTAYYFASESIKLCKEINFKKGLAHAYKLRGIVCFYQANIDKSMENFHLSLSTYQEMGDKNGEAKIYNNMGIIYKTKGKYKKAIEQYEKCINVLIEIDDKNKLFGVYTNIATIYSFLGKYNLAIEYNFNALKVIDEIEKPNDDIIEVQAIINMNIASIYDKQDDYKNARKHLSIALKVYQSINLERGIADTYINLGSVENNEADTINNKKEKEKKYLKAIEYYNKALGIYTDNAKIATANYHIGDSYNKLENYTQSIEFFNKSLELFQKIEDPKGMALCYNGIGEYFFQKEEFNKAIINLQKALNIGTEIGHKESIQDAAEWLSKAYNEIGQYQKAYQTHVLFKQMHDSLFKKENERKQTELSMQFEFDKEEKAKKIQHEAELENQEIIHKAKTRQMRIVIISALLGVILLILLSLFIFRSYNTKKKANLTLKLKNAEIFQQKEEIETQRDEITAQKDDIEKHHKTVLHQKRNIESSIIYAQRIQEAVIPNSDFIKQYLKDYFILFKPRDIVSGDFYWTAKITKNGTTNLIIVASDCTGHGVPGAFMSMLGISFLNEIVNRIEKLQANLILNQLRELIIKSLHQRDFKSESKDGMDIALTIIEPENKTLQYAGAYNPLYLIRNKKYDLPSIEKEQSRLHNIDKCEYNLFEIKADRMPIGIYFKDNPSFNNYKIQLQKEDKIYLFSDGYADQFGGKLNRKYTYKNFKNLLLKNNRETMNQQHKILEQTHNKWKQDFNQLDDIIIIGIQI